MIAFDFSSVDWLVVAVVVGAFLAAGTVKGVLGVGLPMIAVPLIAGVTSPAHAIALASVPVVVSNAWQAFHGGHTKDCARRFWPMLTGVVVGAVVGVQILATFDQQLVSGILGIVLVVFTGLQAMPRTLALDARGERWLGPPLGLVGGVLGGMSSLFGPLLILYLVALRLPKDVFVAAVALLFFVGSLPLFLGLVAHGILSPPQIAHSALSSLPVIAGLVIGRRLRRHVPQALFEKALFVVLIVIGLNLVRRAFF
ncbi:sulfite exporter TauE/SafE family protein [Shumkonia mesophila]|uniref:sulfite exporter TauE/SafE family protein n=1 Tax=Shumkonia mesophila TaxID=2838854 RepID=UPI00293417C2|nr:sulfite exporter TauE/SafE family protein [Shumkonia mesophila]